jgi:hypothetical protein
MPDEPTAIYDFDGEKFIDRETGEAVPWAEEVPRSFDQQPEDSE